LKSLPVFNVQRTKEIHLGISENRLLFKGNLFYYFILYNFAVSGISLCMTGKCSTTKLHPQPQKLMFKCGNKRPKEVESTWVVTHGYTKARVGISLYRYP
jgi:hypothetical protein